MSSKPATSRVNVGCTEDKKKECEKYFNVGSSFSYYLIKKTPNKKSTKVKCLYNKKEYKSDDIYINDDTDFLPILLSKDSLSFFIKENLLFF